jgi:hypothetical protein
MDQHQNGIIFADFQLVTVTPEIPQINENN